MPTRSSRPRRQTTLDGSRDEDGEVPTVAKGLRRGDQAEVSSSHAESGSSEFSDASHRVLNHPLSGSTIIIAWLVSGSTRIRYQPRQPSQNPRSREGESWSGWLRLIFSSQAGQRT